MAKKGSYSKKVVEACETIAEHVVTDVGRRGRGGPPGWPVSVIEIIWYLTRFLPKEFLTTIRELEKSGLKEEEIAPLFWGPSGLSHFWYFADFPFQSLSAKESEEFIERTVSLVSFFRREDSFCRDDKNIIWSSKRIEDEISEAHFMEAKEAGGLLAQINTILWHYCILIQIGHRAYSHEFHGPYPLRDGELLLVREYHGLKPKEVWEFSSDFPYERLTTLEVYKDVEIRLDAFGHIDTSASLPSKLQRCVLKVDQANLCWTADEIADLSKKLLEILTCGNEFVRGFEKNDWVRKLLETRCHWLKPAKDVLKVGWKPTPEILSLVEKIPEAEKASVEFIKKMRSKVVGLPPKEAKEKVTQMFLDGIYQIER